MELSGGDRETLRRLGAKLAEIAALPIQSETSELWMRLNELDAVRPMVAIRDIPWREIESIEPDSLLPTCENEFCRAVETRLRRTIYQWQQFPGDMVVEPVFRLAPVLKGDHFGLDAGEHAGHPDADRPDNSNPDSQGPIAKILNESDLDKITIPSITCDQDATAQRQAILEDAFDDTLDVIVGIAPERLAIAPGLLLARWTGADALLANLTSRPDFVHAIMQRLALAYEARLNQYEELNLLILNNDAQFTGNAGLALTDDLPPKGFNPAHVRCQDIWGSGATLANPELAPESYQDLILQYEARPLVKFGLVSYSSSAPLHTHSNVIRERLPRIRKIGVPQGPTIKNDAEAAAQTLVLSVSPGADLFAADEWNTKSVRAELKTIFDTASTAECHLELVLQNIPTVRCETRRLSDWSRLALELAVKCGG